MAADVTQAVTAVVIDPLVWGTLPAAVSPASRTFGLAVDVRDFSSFGGGGGTGPGPTRPTIGMLYPRGQG